VGTTSLSPTLRHRLPAKLEHRLHVGFYIGILETLLHQVGVTDTLLELAVLYRGSIHGESGLSPDEIKERRALQAAASEWFGIDHALLDIVDPENYLEAVQDLVTGADSIVHQVDEATCAYVPYHLAYKCDGCLFDEFCMKWSAEHDDLSRLPHMSVRDKGALQRAGIHRIRDLATLTQFPEIDAEKREADKAAFVPAPQQEELHRQLAATWPVGPRLDQLVHRARRYRKWKRDPVEAMSYIPSKGYGSLPYGDVQHNPNLVMV
jgi:hypothetical protein